VHFLFSIQRLPITQWWLDEVSEKVLGSIPSPPKTSMGLGSMDFLWSVKLGSFFFVVLHSARMKGDGANCDV
jgi:hypothetical protein